MEKVKTQFTPPIGFSQWVEILSQINEIGFDFLWVCFAGHKIDLCHWIRSFWPKFFLLWATVFPWIVSLNTWIDVAEKNVFCKWDFLQSTNSKESSCLDNYSWKYGSNLHTENNFPLVRLNLVFEYYWSFIFVFISILM